MTYLEPGEKTNLEGKSGAKVNICATAGPVLGPPWQRPENGYVNVPNLNLICHPLSSRNFYEFIIDHFNGNSSQNETGNFNLFPCKPEFFE